MQAGGRQAINRLLPGRTNRTESGFGGASCFRGRTQSSDGRMDAAGLRSSLLQFEAWFPKRAPKWPESARRPGTVRCWDACAPCPVTVLEYTLVPYLYAYKQCKLTFCFHPVVGILRSCGSRGGRTCASPGSCFQREPTSPNGTVGSSPSHTEGRPRPLSSIFAPSLIRHGNYPELDGPAVGSGHGREPRCSSSRACAGEFPLRGIPC